MQITWTNCANQMPPNDFAEIILSDGINNYVFRGYMIHVGWFKAVAIKHKWSEFTKEKWEALNK